MNANSSVKKKLFPLVLTVAVILLDQIVKLIVVRTLPYGRPVEVIGEFLRLTYVQNPALSFSIAHGVGEVGRIILARILPLVVVAILLYYFFAGRDLSQFQRWVLAAILGGGLGNQVDRFLRPGGVVDFIDVKFYGIFGFARWPVFNLADSTVVVAGIILLISYLASGVRGKS